jgi:hypothetical protein
MIALIGNSELATVWLLIAVPTAISYVRFRATRKKNSDTKMQGCLPLANVVTTLGAVLLLLSFGEEWWRTRPEKMLAGFLKIDDTSAFHDLRSTFVGGMDYTAWIYFQTSQERLQQLLKDLDFEKLPKGKLRWPEKCSQR